MVLGTGGTMAGQANGLSAGGYDAGVVPVQALVDGIDLPAGIAVECKQVAALPGQDVGAAVWLALVEAVGAASADGVHGVVVVHGTDTLEETAFALHLVCDPAMPVVVTGAVRPAHVAGADGPANLLAAILAAGAPASAGMGVSIAFDDSLFDPAHTTRTRMTSSREFEADAAGTYGPLTADGPLIWRRRSTTVPRFALTESLPRVDVLVGHADVDARLVEDSLGRGAAAIVWAGTGSGNAPAAVIEALAAAALDGCIVVRASRITGGALVLPDVEVDDTGLGFVAAYTLDASKVRILVQLALAADPSTPIDTLRRLVIDVSGFDVSGSDVSGFDPVR